MRVSPFFCTFVSNIKAMVYKCKIEADSDYGLLLCQDFYLIESIADTFKRGDVVSVEYFITDKEVTEEEAREAFVMKTLGGPIDELDFVLDAYSSYTINELTEELIIGGHDLLEELQSFEGSFLILVINLA